MNRLSRFYRNILPLAVRTPLWHARKALWEGVVERDVRAWRATAAQLRIWLGCPQTQIAVEGARLRVDLRDQGVGRVLYVQRAYEPLETAFLRRRLKSEMVFVDIGANVGYYSVLASRRVGRGGQVLAIEPDPRNFALLSRNIAANGLSNVHAVQVALGAAAAVAQLYRSQENFGDHRLFDTGDSRAVVSTPVLPLDALLERRGLRRVDFIKMDVQGYESRVVAGMRATLAAGSPLVVLTEFWPYGITAAGDRPENLFQVFEECGFRARALTATGPIGPITYADALGLLPPFEPDCPDGSYLNLVFERR